MLGLSYASSLSPRIEKRLATLFTPSPSRVGHPGDPYTCTTCQCMIRFHNVFEIQLHFVNRGFADCFINNEIEGQTSSSAEGRVNHDVSPDLNNAEPEDAQPTVDTEPYFGEDDEEDTCDNPAATNSLIRNIISGSIHEKIIDAEEPNKNAKIFLKLLEQAKKELYPGCKNATKVSFIVELFR